MSNSNPAASAEILRTPLDLDRACQLVADRGHGAIATFSGVVRNSHLGRPVRGITYDCHIPLARNILLQICQEVTTRWPDCHCHAAHFVGELKVGQASVIIAVSSPHRGEAFDACRHVIEQIKVRLPVWKREHYLDGKSDWLPGHSLITDQPAGPVTADEPKPAEQA